MSRAKLAVAVGDASGVGGGAVWDVSVPGVVNLLFDMPPAAWAVAADGAFGWSAVLARDGGGVGCDGGGASVTVASGCFAAAFVRDRGAYRGAHR